MRSSAGIGISRDPFQENREPVYRWRAPVLGAPVEFSSNCRELLGIAREAFADVPPHRWPRGVRLPLRVSLRRARDGATRSGKIPPKPLLSSGAGLLTGHVDARNFVIVDPLRGCALVQVGDAVLSQRPLMRYELVEFAAITLATRVQGLVPLHAGCVGASGRGILLMGSTGSGKSTLTLHAAVAGLEFLAEDSVFVQPRTLRATGISAFAHARADALLLIEDRHLRKSLRAAPVIQRRSGVRKHQIDLRHGLAKFAPGPLRIATTVILSARPARGAGLRPLTSHDLRCVLRAEQPYAAGQPGWEEFERNALRAGGFSLGRMPPADAIAALRTLLGKARA